jgi:hypothetical protein
MIFKKEKICGSMRNGVHVLCNDFDSSWWWWFWHADVGCTTQRRFGMALVATDF